MAFVAGKLRLPVVGASKQAGWSQYVNGHSSLPASAGQPLRAVLYDNG